MTSALIVGATSGIGEALCHLLAARGWELVLCGKRQEHLDAIASDLTIRYENTNRTIVCDLSINDVDISALFELAGAIDHLVVLPGSMPDEDYLSAQAIGEVININYTNPAKIISLGAREMQNQQNGCITVVTSVAGDRGRKKHQIYGSSKSALNTLCEGLRYKLTGSAVDIVTIKPGYVDTNMTWGISSALMARRDRVAKRILKAMDEREACVYVPWFWRYIMLIVRWIPEPLFKRLSL